MAGNLWICWKIPWKHFQEFLLWKFELFFKVSGHFPFGQLSPRTTVSFKLSPRQLPPGFCLPDNYSWTTIPWAIAHMKFPHRTITSQTITPEQFPLPLDNCQPWISSRDKYRRTFVLYNNPWITYRWISKKALFKHSNLQISNKIGIFHFCGSSKNVLLERCWSPDFLRLLILS